MSGTGIALLAALAVVVFWVIGANNRLVGLRNDIVQAWGRVQDTLAQRGAAIEPLVAALREPMAAEHGALDAWLAAHGRASAAAAAMGQRPINTDNAQAWVTAEAALAAAASRVLALLEHGGDWRHDPAIQAPAATWREAQARLPVVRQMFNESAAAYNEAIGIVPTRWLARLLRLERSGSL